MRAPKATQLRAERRAARELVNGKWVATRAPEHGIAKIYRLWSCRCDPCTDANTRENRHVRNGGGPKPPPIRLEDIPDLTTPDWQGAARVAARYCRQQYPANDQTARDLLADLLEHIIGPQQIRRGLTEGSSP